MNRLACVFACLIISFSIFGCSASSTSIDSGTRIVSDAPSSAQIFNAWNSLAATYNFSSAQHLVTLGSLYNGGDFASDIHGIGDAVNGLLGYDTGLQNGTGIMVFCEFTGDGCGTKK